MQGTLDDRLRSIGLSAAEILGFKELLNAAVARRRAQWEKLSPEDQEYWVLDMAELAHEVGIPRLYAGMRKAWTWNKYLAGAAEVRECLPPVPDVAAVPRARHDPHCVDCDGSGWKQVSGPGPDRRVTRCDCDTRPHRTKVAEPADRAWIAAQKARLEAILKMPARPAYPCKAASAPPAPVIPTCAELAEQLKASGWGERAQRQPPPELRELGPFQLQQRKGMERAECDCVEDDLDAQTNGRYEKPA